MAAPIDLAMLLLKQGDYPSFTPGSHTYNDPRAADAMAMFNQVQAAKRERMRQEQMAPQVQAQAYQDPTAEGNPWAASAQVPPQERLQGNPYPDPGPPNRGNPYGQPPQPCPYCNGTGELGGGGGGAPPHDPSVRPQDPPPPSPYTEIGPPSVPPWDPYGSIGNPHSS